MTTTRVNLQIDVNGREASASVVRVQRAFDKLNKEVSENGRAASTASRSQRNLAQSTDRLGRSASR